MKGARPVPRVFQTVNYVPTKNGCVLEIHSYAGCGNSRFIRHDSLGVVILTR